MKRRAEGEVPERIVVALDGSPQSMAALEAAAALASLMRVELCGLFVEDQNLQKLCALPFSAEIGAYSATVRQLSTNCIPREFRAVQMMMEAKVEEAARSANVAWTFQISTGDVNDELLSASETATIFGLGRSSHIQNRRLGSTARKVLAETTSPVLFPSQQRYRWASLQDRTTVVYTGTTTADRTLAFAVKLAQHSESDLRVLIRNQTTNKIPTQTTKVSRSTATSSDATLATRVANKLTGLPLATRFIEEKQSLKLLQLVQSTANGVLVLPMDYAEENSVVLDSTAAPVVVVS